MKLPKSEPKDKPRIEDFEDNIAAEQSVVLNEFKKRAADEQARDDDATNSTFHMTVCFQTFEQMREFMSKSGWDKITSEKFIDGMKVAKRMGIKLESPVPPIRKRNKFGGEYLNNILE